MRAEIFKQKDFWTGVVYVLFGVAAFVIARNYHFGSAARMGPGYFPTAVSALLVVVGAVIVARSFGTPGGYLEGFAWKPILLLTASIAAFGFLINRAGLVIAAVTLVLGSAAASRQFQLGWMPLLGLVALIGFCVVVFVIGMGIPMPLLGSWFGEAGF